jgi:AraC-like DNA-binding protein
MSEAAKLARMSTSTFSRFFKKNVGQNFIDFVHKVRISQACNLLANSSELITDICFACGYNNISNFNWHFLRSKRVIPSVYRRMSLDRFEAEPPRISKRVMKCAWIMRTGAQLCNGIAPRRTFDATKLQAVP